MDLTHLKYFKVVAEYEHMTRATEDLHVAQSAVSKVIKGIEEYFGVKLFDRVGKNIVLNDNGRILLKYTERILNSVEEAEQELADRNSMVEKGAVVILMRVFSKFLPDLVLGFREKYPNIKLVIMQHNSNEKWDICIDATINPLKGKNSRMLLQEKIFLALPPEHNMAKRKSICLSDLKNENFICLRGGSSLNDVTNYYCNLAGFEPKIILESDTPATLRGIMPLGLGVSFIPEFAWEGVDFGSVSLVTVDNFQCIRYINLILQKKDYHSHAVLLFEKYVMDFFCKLKMRLTK